MKNELKHTFLISSLSDSRITWNTDFIFLQNFLNSSLYASEEMTPTLGITLFPEEKLFFFLS